MLQRNQIYIDGRWQEPQTSAELDVINPATEEVLYSIPESTVSDVDRAVAAARAAFPVWSQTTAQQRIAYMHCFHHKLSQRIDELAEIITDELGMPLKLSKRIQATVPARVVESYTELLETYNFTERVGNSRIIREPVGVVAAITPWTYPLHQLVVKVAAALAAGCTVVVKPSELTPMTAFVLTDIIDSCGLPPGVFNLVSGSGPFAGEALASHPDVDMVSFTGSTLVGRRISVLAADTVKRVVLELGGKSASIVLNDAPLEEAIRSTMNSCFLNSGQSCSAQTRLLVSHELYDQAAKIACDLAPSYKTGSPRDPDTKIGPLASELQRKRVLEYIHKGIEEGADLLVGGVEPPEGLEHTGFYVQPTVFGNVSCDMTIAQEEVFGPVLCIMPYLDEDDAIAIANNSRYGLSGAVWSADQKRAERVAQRMHTGQVDINGGRFNILAPFGGYKQSGNGRELGRFGLEDYLEVKSIQY